MPTMQNLHSPLFYFLQTVLGAANTLFRQTAPRLTRTRSLPRTSTFQRNLNTDAEVAGSGIGLRETSAEIRYDVANRGGRLFCQLRHKNQARFRLSRRGPKLNITTEVVYLNCDADCFDLPGLAANPFPQASVS